MSNILINGTFAPNGPFPIINDTDSYGGFRVVADITTRNAIIDADRKEGMWVHVVGDAVYSLNAAPWNHTNSDWTAVVLGSDVTLQSAYNGSTPATILLNSSNGGLDIRDNSTPLGTALLKVDSYGGITTYFQVDTTQTLVNGDLNILANMDTFGPSGMFIGNVKATSLNLGHSAINTTSLGLFVAQQGVKTSLVEENATNILVNGDFGTGNFAGWTTNNTGTATSQIIINFSPGVNAAELGGPGPYNGTSYVYQAVAVPAYGQTVLSINWAAVAPSNIDGWFRGQIRNATQSALLYDILANSGIPGFTQGSGTLAQFYPSGGNVSSTTLTADLTPFAGQTVVIYFDSVDTNNDIGNQSYSYIMQGSVNNTGITVSAAKVFFTHDIQANNIFADSLDVKTLGGTLNIGHTNAGFTVIGNGSVPRSNVAIFTGSGTTAGAPGGDVNIYGSGGGNGNNGVPGGNGGVFAFTGGNGGAGSSAFPGGMGGQIVFVTGSGGIPNGANGGPGGPITLRTGSGGDGNANDNGGAGGDILIQAERGGGTLNGVGGRGGNITLRPGDGGIVQIGGGGTPGAAGQIILNGVVMVDGVQINPGTPSPQTGYGLFYNGAAFVSSLTQINQYSNGTRPSPSSVPNNSVIFNTDTLTLQQAVSSMMSSFWENITSPLATQSPDYFQGIPVSNVYPQTPGNATIQDFNIAKDGSINDSIVTFEGVVTIRNLTTGKAGSVDIKTTYQQIGGVISQVGTNSVYNAQFMSGFSFTVSTQDFGLNSGQFSIQLGNDNNSTDLLEVHIAGFLYY